MQNQYPRVSEIKETIYANEVNRLLKEGWVILSLNFVGECPTKEAAICFAYVLGKEDIFDWRSFETDGYGNFRKLRAEDALNQQGLVRKWNEDGSSVLTVKPESTESQESEQAIPGVQFWTNRGPDGEVEINFNGKTRLEMSREDAVHLAWLLISPPTRSTEDQPSDSLTRHFSAADSSTCDKHDPNGPGASVETPTP